MTLNLRIIIANFLVIGLGTYLLLNIITTEISPGIRQSTEDTLVEMSNLLAEMVADEYTKGQLQTDNFSNSMERFLARDFQANIYSVKKQYSDSRIYITDQLGIVVYDSDNKALGQDYSQWNDVYLTLRGEYGVRTSLINSEDDTSTIMHVAAPIMNNGDIVGVLTVAKPSLAVQPFVEMTQVKIKNSALIILAISLLFGVALALWLTRSIRALTRYADVISQGGVTSLPKLNETELNKLGQAMARMRKDLEGKDYVEKYVHSLTHELKSPVSAIKGAVELIDENMSPQAAKHFLGNISHEADRLDDIISRLLQLVKVESREALESIENIKPENLINEIIRSKETLLAKRNIQIKLPDNQGLNLQGEKFLLTQALDNLIQNAIDFSEDGSEIDIAIQQHGATKESQLIITIEDQGSGIPEYAIDKIFERFYSLTRPSTGKKSSGLGLSFVRQVIQLHQGIITIKNNSDQGVTIQIILPVLQKH